MVELAGKQTSPTVNRVASALNGRNRVSSHFDDLLTSPEELSKQRLANELATELWSRLPISRCVSESGDRGIDHTLQIVTANTSQVSAWYQELAEFVSAIAKAAVVLRGQALTDSLQVDLTEEMERQMLEQIRFPLPDRSFVDFKFADLPPAEAWTQAHQRLERACLEFANHVFGLFDTLQQKKLIGQIQETSSTCRFTHFRRVAVAKLAGARTQQRVLDEPTNRVFQGHGVTVATLQITDFEIQHQHSQHVHHVRNPTLNEPDSTVNPLPVKYMDLIAACPDWMSGTLRVLEGELFRHECIEWDLFTETRSAEHIIERVRRDPAVVFGPYILAGWGEDAIAEEENRQRDKRNEAARIVSAKKARIHHMFSFAASGLAIALIAFSGSATALITSFAIVIGLVAMVLAGYAAHLASIARGSVVAGRVMLHSTLIGASVFAVQGLIFSILHWSLPAFGLAVLSAVVATIAFNVTSADTELGGSGVG